MVIVFELVPPKLVSVPYDLYLVITFMTSMCTVQLWPTLHWFEIFFSQDSRNFFFWFKVNKKIYFFFSMWCVTWRGGHNCTVCLMFMLLYAIARHYVVFVLPSPDLCLHKTGSHSWLSTMTSAWKSGPVQSFVKIWQDWDWDQSSQVEEPQKNRLNRHQLVQCGFGQFFTVERPVL